MSIETILIWMGIGLIAGWAASALVGGGFGIAGDILLGIVGAILGGLIFRGMRWHLPFGGLGATIFVAFVGSVVLLILLRLIRRSSPRSRL